VSSANDILLDEAIRHKLFIEKYERGLANKIVRLLNSADNDIRETLAKRLINIETRGYDLGPVTTKRLQDLLTEVSALNSAVYQKAGAGLKIELTNLAGYEIEGAAEGLKSALGIGVNVPPANYLRTLVEKSPIGGRVLDAWTSKQAEDRRAGMEQAIRIGLVEGENTDKIVSRIFGTKADLYTVGTFGTSRRNAQTFVLTAASTVSNNAREEVYKRNSELLRGLRWTSTLDTRTSSFCQSHDGKIYAIGDAHPSLPAHPRCRSILVPITRKFDEKGVPEIAPGKRASMDGQVPKSTTFGDWIEKQSQERQDAVFGSERAQLFRDGKVKFADLYRENGEFRSLDELRKAEAKPAPKADVKPAPKPAAEVLPKVDTAKLDADARSYVLRKGEATGKEHLVGYDAETGVEVERKAGTKSSVVFSQSLVDRLSDPRSSIILHHNHPGSSSLSLPDVKVLDRPGAKAIFAHGHNSSQFYAERGADPLKVTTVNAISDSLFKALQAMVNARKIEPDEAGLMHNHLVWLALHNVGQLTYRADLAGESADIFARNKQTFLALLESLK
jgi:SPP1 gp7 family putative phage head morphogenesis protein